MNIEFVTNYKLIIKKLNSIDPIKYGQNRNYINGAVTYLSPYISRGVISTHLILNHVMEKGYQLQDIIPFVKELCWRDYFQRVAQSKDVNNEIRQKQTPVLNNAIPSQILNASTGIEGIDIAIKELIKSGYMHNHCRMYTASIICNIAKSHWHHPAQWMYYHLLDGDWASNACSWQWVAGANSNKKYFVNQENINKYTFTNQKNTFIDTSYEEIEKIEIPVSLLDTEKYQLDFELPESNALEINPELPTFIYNYYNLDPLWHKGELGNRILLIEPQFFSRFPISKKCMNFMWALSENIPDLKVFIGSFNALISDYNLKNIFFKEHPLNIDYIGIVEERDWIAKEISDYYPSFFSYWKKVEPLLLQKYH